jgi:hypothetical protein
MRYTSNFRMKKSSQYMHSGVRQMCESASSDIERALAREVRNKLYEGMAEWLSVTRPVFDRSVQREDEFMAKQQQNLAREQNGNTRATLLSTVKEYSEHLLEKDLRDQRLARDPGYSYETLPEMVTRAEMIGLYIKAIAVDFTPSNDTPFTLLAEVPSELHGFHELDYRDLLTPIETPRDSAWTGASFKS